MSNSGLFITWPQLLYLGIVVLSFYVVELLFFWLRHGRKNKSSINLEQFQVQLDDLRQELASSKVKIAALAAQLHAANLLDDPVFPLSLHSNPLETADSLTESPYAHAIRLAQTGADAPEVAAACGISRGEADLIVAIYRSAERN
ncbi:DUF2802 domain-containing protein [uncultured Deefgea sp.]|uniref:DUF2802 domain-containing protein n=1 Tax=uncultured Deefgea sp. TaxID=1304914 RepID=UPI002597DA37|nr:DUF2802 domain-containing protein [uncultured Deefgea sp.]